LAISAALLRAALDDRYPDRHDDLMATDPEVDGYRHTPQAPDPYPFLVALECLLYSTPRSSGFVFNYRQFSEPTKTIGDSHALMKAISLGVRLVSERRATTFRFISTVSKQRLEVPQEGGQERPRRLPVGGLGSEWVAGLLAERGGQLTR